MKDGAAAGCEDGKTYPVADSDDVLKFFADATEAFKKTGDTAALVKSVLGNPSFWGQDLNLVPGLAPFVTEKLECINKNGIRAAVKTIL